MSECMQQHIEFVCSWWVLHIYTWYWFSIWVFLPRLDHSIHLVDLKGVLERERERERERGRWGWGWGRGVLWNTVTPQKVVTTVITFHPTQAPRTKVCKMHYCRHSSTHIYHYRWALSTHWRRLWVSKHPDLEVLLQWNTPYQIVILCITHNTLHMWTSRYTRTKFRNLS